MHYSQFYVYKEQQHVGYKALTYNYDGQLIFYRDYYICLLETNAIVLYWK